MKINYKNRYGDEFTFEKTDDGHIFMSGPFQYMRWGYPNDYTKAYNTYLEDRDGVENVLSLEEFKRDVHEYQGDKHLYPEYVKLVGSNVSVINMIDPSGGPHLCEGMDMGTFSEEFKGMIIKEFKGQPDGYKILING